MICGTHFFGAPHDFSIDKIRRVCYHTEVAESGIHMGEWWNW